MTQVIPEFFRSKRTPVQTQVPTPGRNAPCTCASGKKFKHCCGAV